MSMLSKVKKNKLKREQMYKKFKNKCTKFNSNFNNNRVLKYQFSDYITKILIKINIFKKYLSILLIIKVLNLNKKMEK